MQMADASEDGLISYSEFMLTCVNREKFLTMERLEAVFNELDIDKNHHISLNELNQFLGSSEHMDKEALAEAFAQVDQRNQPVNPSTSNIYYISSSVDDSDCDAEPPTC